MGKKITFDGKALLFSFADGYCSGAKQEMEAVL
jgi:hypothetical protein